MLASFLQDQTVVRILLEAVVVIGAIYMGVRAGGLAIGLWGGVGVFILAFLLGVPPGSPPIDAMLIVLTVVAAASAMQAAGGTDYLVMVASRIIRAHPKQITWVAPLVSFLFTVGAGTGNIYFALLPVIYEVAYANDIRPEKPLAASATASQMAVICSPVSAAMAAMLVLVGMQSGLLDTSLALTLPKILMIILPASLIGVLALSTVQNFIGKPLAQDPEYQKRLAEGRVLPPEPLHDLTPDEEAEVRKGRLPAFIFLAGVAFIMLLALVPSLRPSLPLGEEIAPLSMNAAIQLVMILVAVLIIMLSKVTVSDISKQGTWSSGITSMIALFGVAWLASTFIAANSGDITTALGSVAEKAPWMLAIAMFLVSAFTTSQSTTTNAIVPIGLSLGIAPWLLVAMWPAVIGIYAFPANGSQIASVEMDQTGTTKLSKFILWHSFTIPMLVGAVVSVLAGLAIGYLLMGFGA